MVPHLITALEGPLQDLERRLLDASAEIERWFRLQWQEHTPTDKKLPARIKKKSTKPKGK